MECASYCLLKLGAVVEFHRFGDSCPGEWQNHPGRKRDQWNGAVIQGRCGYHHNLLSELRLGVQLPVSDAIQLWVRAGVLQSSHLVARKGNDREGFQFSYADPPL